jgi:hypothetical protein
MRKQAVGFGPKYFWGTSQIMGEKCFLFAVYLSVWEQIGVLEMCPHSTASESTINAVLDTEVQGCPHKDQSCFVISVF